LRRLQSTDLDDLFALYRDPEVRRYFPDGALTLAQTSEELDWFVNGGDPAHPQLGLWATIHKPSGRFIGRCGLIPWTIEDRLEIEIAYLLAKDVWRQGLGAEAAAALVRHGFGPLGLTRLIALIDRGNAASRRTALRAGLAFEREIEMDDTRCDVYAIARGG
jgi:[ribosomal protein S5]-alanine N-acetyltransferase